MDEHQSPRLDLYDVELTCIAAPSRWSARTADGQPVDIRFRHGILTVRIGERGQTAEETKLAPEWFDEMVMRHPESIADWEEVASWANLVCMDSAPPDRGY
jgi:hypothetical protein